VIIVHIDHIEKTLRAAYNAMETDDGSDAARQIRTLVESYDPARQVVIVYRDAARRKDLARVVDIEPRH